MLRTALPGRLPTMSQAANNKGGLQSHLIFICPRRFLLEYCCSPVQLATSSLPTGSRCRDQCPDKSWNDSMPYNQLLPLVMANYFVLQLS